MSKFKDFWKSEINEDKETEKAVGFKVGDRVTPLSGTTDAGEVGTVAYVNGHGVKINFDNGESETYGDDEIKHA